MGRAQTPGAADVSTLLAVNVRIFFATRSPIATDSLIQVLQVPPDITAECEEENVELVMILEGYASINHGPVTEL